MEHTFTTKDITRYIYRETNEGENILIKNAIFEDENLRAVYEELLASKRLLDSVSYQPKDATVNRILQYSKQAKPMETSR